MASKSSSSSQRRTSISGTSLLFHCVQQRLWDDVVKQAHHCPTEASMWVVTHDTNTNKNVASLPIHQACTRKPTLEAIRALIEAYPESVQEMQTDSLPIHDAVECGSSVEVVETLLYAYPKSAQVKDRKNRTLQSILETSTSNTYGTSEREQLLGLFSGKIEPTPLTATNKSKLAKSKGEVTDTGISATKKKDTTELDGLRNVGLSVVVIGASGDLAKKKTYPSLLDLFVDDLLPPGTVIWGYARSKLSHEDLRARIRPYLLKQKKSHTEDLVNDFLQCCYYQSGSSYGDHDAFQEINQHLLRHEQKKPQHINTHNRLFYLAVPPNVFAETGLAIKENAMTLTGTGWTRVIVEKPFGRDLSSCEKLLQSLNQNFAEDQLYRIDHYLGKEMVQNLLVMRFANRMYERLWSRDDIEAVIITFKEPFGTEGRGGYFDQFGIIRDILQNHLLQVMTLLAMEPPTRAFGPGSSDHIRDEKVRVLRAIPPITIDDVYLGQYEGYTDDPTIENKDSITPTFAAMKLSVQNPRWAGVPFILKAGKALDERKAEMRIQFKDAPASDFLFSTNPEKDENPIPRNELVIRMQPHEAIYIKTNFKSPGFASTPIQGELEVNYDTRFFQDDRGSETGKGKNINPAAYTRLILDVIRGRQAAFVRADELLRSWEIFTPVLDKMEQEKLRPHPYTTGSRGPVGADQWIFEKSGYIRNKAYKFHDQNAPSKSQ